MELAVRVIDGPSEPAVFRRRHLHANDRAARTRFKFPSKQVFGLGLPELPGLGDDLIGQRLIGRVNDECFIVSKTDAEQRRWLQLEDVSIGQGYLFSKPHEAEEIDQYLEDFSIFSGKPL